MEHNTWLKQMIDLGERKPCQWWMELQVIPGLRTCFPLQITILWPPKKRKVGCFRKWRASTREASFMMGTIIASDRGKKECGIGKFTQSTQGQRKHGQREVVQLMHSGTRMCFGLVTLHSSKDLPFTHPVNRFQTCLFALLVPCLQEKWSALFRLE